MTNPFTPEAILQKVEDNLIYMKSNQWECVYSGDLELILEYYLQLQAENEELKKIETTIIAAHHKDVERLSQERDQAIAVLKAIADKECYHAYPSSVMVDVCEACKARVFLQSTNHYND